MYNTSNQDQKAVEIIKGNVNDPNSHKSRKTLLDI